MDALNLCGFPVKNTKVSLIIRKASDKSHLRASVKYYEKYTSKLPRSTQQGISEKFSKPGKV